jgi:hypothetical protein
MSLYEKLQKASSEEHVKDICIKALGFFEGLVLSSQPNPVRVQNPDRVGLKKNSKIWN